MSLPIVSVIIPTYKRADSLPRAIDSVLQQTYSNVEVIVVDDNDPNTEWRKATSNFMERYATDSRVKYIKHKCNKNGSAARNTGTAVANGEYLCFLDDDDYYLSSKIEAQVSYMMKHSTIQGCYCDYRFGDIPHIVKWKKDFSKDILLGEHTPQTSGWLITKDAVTQLDGFDASYVRHQDYEFLLRYYKKGFKLGKVEKILYVRDSSKVCNSPQGEKREAVKRKLMKDFSDVIVKIDNNNHGFKKAVFTKNMAKVFENYAKSKRWNDAFRILKEMLSCSAILSVKFISLDVIAAICDEFKKNK